MTPDDAKKRLQQLKAEAMMRAEKEKQYKAATANQYTKDMPSMKEFKAKQRKTGLEKFLEHSHAKERLYHGTGSDIKEFDKQKIKRPYFGHGFHLAESPSLASFYADQFKEGQNVMPVHAQIKNPFVLKSMTDWYDVPGNTDAERTDWIKNKGYDGIKYPHGAPYNAPHESGMGWVAFEPHQIKSAIGNRGTYDPNDPDITKADGGPIHMAKGGSEISPAVNLQMANEAAEKVGQHSNPYTRSLQQGWEHGWYHGSTGDIKSFRPDLLGESTGAASAKKGYFFARDPSTPPAHMVEHDPQSVEMLTKLGKPIPANPTMAGHGAQTAGSYAGTGGSREYKEAMRKAKAAEKSGKWDDYEKYMTEAEDSVSNEMQYRQGLVAKHGDARDEMLEKINNAWYGAQNSDKFKKMSQGEYEAHDKLHKELMPYGWYTSPLYDDKMYQNLIGHISSATGHKHSKEAIDAIKKYRSVHNERKAADVESGANILPVALRYKNPMYYDFQGKSYRDQTYSDLMDEAKRKGHDALILKNTYDPGGSGGVDKMVDVGVVFHPHQIRSKFAAFHPDRGNESDLLAARGGPIHMAKGGSDTPKKTVKAYKMFRVHPKHPGKLFPLFVDSNTPVDMHKWIDAKEGEMRNGKVKSKIGDLAYRPGWHAGDLPVATHIGDKDEEQKAEIKRIKELRSAMLQDIGDDKQGKAIVKKMYPFPEWANAPRLRNARHIWAEVEMPHDVDWQSEATKRGYNDEGKFIANQAHITDQLPKGGHYRYKTNSNMTGNWLIGGGMKVNRILPDEEVQRINEAAGAADLPRAKPMKQEAFGFADGGTVAPEEWMAEEHVNHKPKAAKAMASGGQPPSLDVMKLALTKHGMYSPLEKATMGVNRTKGTPAEFMAEASKQPGFRKEEVADRKLQLPDQKLTKAEMLQHLQKSPLPKITEHILEDFGDEEDALQTASQAIYGQDYDEVYDDRKAREKVEQWVKKHSSKYQDYQLPGGKNYREVLLQTPHFGEHDEHRMMELEANRRRSPQPKFWGLDTGEAKELADLMQRKESMGDQYHSSHWEGHPNIIAHMRMSDREAPGEMGYTLVNRKSGLKSPHFNTPEEAKAALEAYPESIRGSLEMQQSKGPKRKLLHIEEIQSDLHQAGRKHGYDVKPTKSKNPDGTVTVDFGNNHKTTFQNDSYANDAIQTATLKTGKSVPDMPFKKNWHELALKHALHHAAKHGYHGVVITPGQEQADRYPRRDESEKIAQEAGMKGFYDKIVPEYLNKLGKPHGVNVEMHGRRIKGAPEDYANAVEKMNIAHIPMNQLTPEQNQQIADTADKKLHHFPITEPMRQQILQGQPMYKQGGIIHKAEGGNVQPNIAQMRMALQQRNPIEAQNIGVNEAPNMLPKIYFPPSQNENDDPTAGNSFNQYGIPIGGVDQDRQQPGQQLMAQQQVQPPQGAQPPQVGLTPQGGPQGGSQGPTPQMGNMLSMTPQGQTMQALAPKGPPGPPGIPSGPPGAPTQPAPTGMKRGGPAYFDKGGLSSSDQEMDAALAHANSIPKSKKPTVAEMKEAIFQKAQQGLMKPSEALGKHEGAYLHITESDRAKVEKRKHGMRGGVGFSQIGLEEPEYAGRTWGVGKSSVQSKLLNRQKRGLSPEDKSIWTTFIGTPEMHTSNQLVFNRMWNKFQEARKSGLLSPEQEAKMLDILRSAMTKATPKKPAQAIFEPDANFDNTHHLFDTFERRRILSNLMAGNKVGGKKGQIFDASKMIEETTDPRLLHAPTLSVGPHTFSFSGETSYEPHLNKAFPYILHGEAHPDTFQQIPFIEAAPDFTNQIRQTKGREPGYMDIVRGIPRQHISEKFLTGLQKLGRKKGGDVKLAPTQDTMRLALTKKKAK